MKNAKIIAFAATKQPKRAKEFYEKTLGLRLVSEDGFAIVFEVGGKEASNRVAGSRGARVGNGIMLRVQKVEKLVAAGHTVLGWEVGDIQDEVGRLRERGVKFERYEFLQQDESGVWVSPAGGKIAWFRDPDGNILSLTEFPK